MIKQVAHDVPAADGPAGPDSAGPGLAGPGLAGPGFAGPGFAGPSGLGLALAVAAELHAPVTRAPEVAPAAGRTMVPRRKSKAAAARTARTRRTTVG
ncbi:hypothetical protein [Streptomyces heilongjiangensis]|uniref:Uncharacterized protein n=1 Tax=Streptomyces heilongjiangensis TaxID=945052 RepID=A0ABW1BHV5_9ACTN|nr:hypothetical protein [Streptomyces heilongjiangensis]MDC2951351.1 hypothetical protein [Streptomyces heilongjiangensis]